MNFISLGQAYELLTQIPFHSLRQILSGITGLYNQCRCNFILLKTRGPNGVTDAEPHTPNQDFTTVSSYPQNRFLKPVNKIDQHWLKSLACWPQWTPTSPKGRWLSQHADFLLSMVSYSCPFSYEGLVPLYTSSELLSHCWMGFYPIHESLSKANEIFKVYTVTFCVCVCFFFNKEMTKLICKAAAQFVSAPIMNGVQLLHIFTSTCFYVSKFPSHSN